MIKSSVFAVVFATVAALGPAGAASLTYTGFVVDDKNTGTFPTPAVTVDDDTNAGFLTFSIGSSGVSGSLQGFMFDTSGIELQESDILNASASIAAFQSAAGAVSNLGRGVNAKGDYDFGAGITDPKFDVGLRIAPTDVSVVPFTFQISTSVLTLADLIGDPNVPQFSFVRFSSVSGDGVNRDTTKLLGATTAPAAVPLPAAAWLLLAGIGGLVGVRRFAT
ncbi:MAG: VPLPA-CTERM sorting domain-containing protein [Rhodobacteraceae bacterium]|nr:VPLPA-CTERM sorting domain-containing protein [Paracoccaceae bacterium]